MIQRVTRWLGVWLLICGLIGALAPAATEAASSHFYTLTALPMPPGTDGWTVGGTIDDAGDVAGPAADSSGFQHVLIWKHGSSSAVQPAAGAKFQYLTHDGKVLYWNLSDGELHQYVISTGADTVVTNVLSTPNAMNASGMMVGAYLPSNSEIEAAGEAPLGSTNVNQITDLGFGIDSAAHDINDSGDVVGDGTCSTSTDCAYFYDHTTHTATVIGPTNGDDQSATMQAFVVSSTGEAIGQGWFNFGSYRPGFKYTKANGLVFLGMGTSGTGAAEDVNASGDIVGEVDGIGPVLWPADSTDPINLNNQIVLNSLTNWSLGSAGGINDDGLIAANGSLNGQSTEFILTPAQDSTAPTSTGSVVDGSDTLAPQTGSGWYTESTLKLRVQVQDNDGGFGAKSLTVTVNGHDSTTNVSASGQTIDAVTFSEGVNSVSYYATDLAGNSESPQSLTVNYDKTPPTWDCSDVPTGWHKGNIDVQCTPKDSVSGVATPDGTFELSTSVDADTETLAATTNVETVCDVAENCTEAQLTDLMIDNKAPVVTCDPVDSDWHGSDVVLNCSAEDGGSGLLNNSDAKFTLSTTVPSASETDSASTDSRSVCDVVGNCVQVGPFGPIKVDKENPKISGSPTTLANSNGWYDTAVTVRWTCSDQGSGVASCPADDQITAEGAAETVSATATDNVGNQTQGTSSPAVNIDLTNPTVTYSGNHGTYTVDQTVNITCGANDNLSGVASDTCQNISGPASSFALGSNSFSASATDKAGNLGNGSVSFNVEVTPDSLCALTKQLVGNKTAGMLLCQPFAGVKTAENAHNQILKNLFVQSYIMQVNLQRNLSPSQKATLTRLAKGL